MASKPYMLWCLSVWEALAPEEGEARGRDDVLPEGLGSFGFLLTGSLEFPLSLFVDTRDTSVFVPGEKEHQIFKVEAMICSELSSHPTLCLQEWNHPREGVPPSADQAWAVIVLHSLFSLARFPLAFVLWEFWSGLSPFILCHLLWLGVLTWAFLFSGKPP